MLASINADSFLILGLYSPLALAYLDPGTGSMILQVVLGAVASLAVSVTTFWPKLKTFVVRCRPW